MASDSGDYTGVRESRSGGDDGVGDEVVNTLYLRDMSEKQHLEQQ